MEVLSCSSCSLISTLEAKVSATVGYMFIMQLIQLADQTAKERWVVLMRKWFDFRVIRHCNVYESFKQVHFLGVASQGSPRVGVFDKIKRPFSFILRSVV